jgi:hypothetical protein
MLDALPKERTLWPRDRRHALIAGVWLWVIPMLVIAVLVAINPLKHTVTVDSYHKAAQAWWDGQDLYVGPSGMNYLPHFAVLYSPFHFLPFRLSEILWRFCAAASLVVGLWRLAQLLFHAERERAFLWMTLLAMPLSMGALRNGNANALFGGILLLAIVAAMEQRWTLAVGWMALEIALKPLGIVLLGLAALFYTPVIRRVPAAILGLAIFPFLFGRPSYVWSQDREAWSNLRACAAVTEHRFADLNGILRTFGAPLSTSASTIVRVAAGALTALLWVWGARRLAGDMAQYLWLYALASAYLMVFNPMNEANSYVILAPALAVWAVYFLLDNNASDRGLGWTIALMTLSMGLLPNILRPWLGNYFALCWHPFMTIVFVVILAQFAGRWKPVPSAAVGAQPGHCV